MSKGKNADLTAPMEFEELQRREVSIKIGGKSYVLLEAMAGDVASYRNQLVRSAKVDPSKKTASMQGYADAELGLLCACLFELVPARDPDRPPVKRAVSIGTVKSWRYEIQNGIWERLRQLSGLDVEDDDIDLTAEELMERRADIDQRLEKLSHTNGEVLPSPQEESAAAHVEQVKN